MTTENRGTAANRPRDLRRALLEAAEAEITGNGLSNLSLRAVARRVGVSHQAPGHHFGGKRGLLTALAAHAANLLLEHLERTAVAAADLPARERLSALGVAYVEFAVQHAALFAIGTRSDTIDFDDPELSKGRAAAWGLLASTVAEAQATGWRAEQDTADVVLLCWTVVHGAASLTRDGLAALQLDESSLRNLARTVTDAL